MAVAGLSRSAPWQLGATATGKRPAGLNAHGGASADASGTGPLQDRAARRDLHRGNTPCVQHQESIAVPAAEHARILREGADHVVDDLALTPRTAVVVRHVHAVAAHEPNTKHKPFHASQSRRAQSPTAMDLHGASA